MYFQEVVCGPRDGRQLATPGSPQDGFTLPENIMSKHGARFQMLQREYIVDLGVRAIAANGAKATQSAGGLAHAQIALDLFLAREKGATSAVGARPQMLLSSVRLGEAQLCHSEEMVSAPPKPSRRPAGTSWRSSPCSRHRSLCSPRWLPLVCLSQERKFAHTALVISFAGAVWYFKFLWAKQRPQWACFCFHAPRRWPKF